MLGLIHISAAILIAQQPGTVTARASVHTDTAAAEGEAFVRSFFAAFDRRDLKAVEKAFLPTAKIIHDDGVATNIPAMLKIITKAKDWPSRTRSISDCDTSTHGSVLVVGCMNRVTFQRPGSKPAPYEYNETWVLQRTAAGLKAIRSHYSRVTQEEHSEEVP